MLHIGVINVAFIDCLLCIFHVNSGLMCRLSEIVNLYRAVLMVDIYLDVVSLQSGYFGGQRSF